MIGFASALCALLAGAEVQAVQQETFETLELRVVSIRPRQVVVDRGMTDGLMGKDRVTFRPRDGRVVTGTVVASYERDALVELDDPRSSSSRDEGRGADPELAAPGEAAAREGGAPKDAPAPAVVPPAAPPEHLRGSARRRRSGGRAAPARIRPVRPEEREPSISGRVYSIFDYWHTTEGAHADTFARTGTSLLFENLGRSGGELRFDAEANYRHADVPDGDDDGEERSALRLDRFSYTHGGNRFSNDRFEFGRFLHHEMPEFGVLDGGQWTHRLPGGDTFGASAGFLPDADSHQDTGDDLEFAGYYRWVADESEQLSMAGGYQKTFHHLDSDRDLLVGKIVYLPVRGGWDFTGTAWVDLYTQKDEAKGSGLGLTQAYLSTGKRFDSGSTMRFTYTHQEFPETELGLFTPVTFAELADAHPTAPRSRPSNASRNVSACSRRAARGSTRRTRAATASSAWTWTRSRSRARGSSSPASRRRVASARRSAAARASAGRAGTARGSSATSSLTTTSRVQQRQQQPPPEPRAGELRRQHPVGLELLHPRRSAPVRPGNLLRRGRLHPEELLMLRSLRRVLPAALAFASLVAACALHERDMASQRLWWAGYGPVLPTTASRRVLDVPRATTGRSSSPTSSTTTSTRRACRSRRARARELHPVPQRPRTGRDLPGARMRRLPRGRPQGPARIDVHELPHAGDMAPHRAGRAPPQDAFPADRRARGDGSAIVATPAPRSATSSRRASSASRAHRRPARATNPPHIALGYVDRCDRCHLPRRWEQIESP
jgi:hypothetical protein